MTKKLLLSAAWATCLADAEARVRLGVRSKWLTKNYRQHYKSYVQPFFGDCPVVEITSQRCRAFRDHMADNGLKMSSIKPVLSLLNQILKMAFEDGHISKVPRMPSQEGPPTPRPPFSREQYITLRQTNRKLEKANPPESVRGHPITVELRNAITMQVASFLRPSDITNMQHKHVDIVQAESGEWFLRLNLPSSKGHTAPVISMPWAVAIYRRQKRLHAASFGRPDDYVFFPAMSRRLAREIYRRQFTKLMTLAGIEQPEGGPNYTLYSLRHSAIMFRLRNSKGMNLLTLARTCRTSVEMIDRYYASRFSAEMNVEELHSFKRPTRYVEGKSGTIREVPRA